MCSAHVMHTPIRLTPSTTQCVRFSRIRHLMPIPPLPVVRFWRIGQPHHVSCPTCPIRAKRTTTMLISRSTCPILEKRTSKQPKNTRWMSETPESDAQSVAPLEFSYGKWREQGWLRRTEAHRASSSSRRTAYIFLRKMAARHADLRLRGFWCKLVDCLRAWRNGRRAVFRWQ